jgi:hypothetical protein
MIISGAFYVAVLQAILIATILLQFDGEAPSIDRNSNNNEGSGLVLQYGQRHLQLKTNPCAVAVAHRKALVTWTLS